MAHEVRGERTGRRPTRGILGNTVVRAHAGDRGGGAGEGEDVDAGPACTSGAAQGGEVGDDGGSHGMLRGGCEAHPRENQLATADKADTAADLDGDDLAGVRVGDGMQSGRASNACALG